MRDDTKDALDDQHSYGTCVECGNRILEEDGGYMQSRDTGARAHIDCAIGKAEYAANG